MFDVEKIAERRIVEAMEHGEFDNLSGAGRPLNLDDDAGIPESLRMAYRVMKNAGVLPPEIDLRREIASVRNAVAALTEAEPRAKGITRRQAARLSLRPRWLCSGSPSPVRSSSPALHTRGTRRRCCGAAA